MVTTLRIPIELKRRINRIAAKEARSAHSFMLEALARHAARAEKYAAFLDEAELASEEARAGARTYSVEEVREAIQKRRMRSRKAR